ncbi:MAG TPA: hypothetical protein VHS28_08975, partial [Chloroflexota bacterium]|nr:hypothetical protein [Chloroflexota bacterium]
EVDSTQTEPETEPEASEYGAEPEVETVEPEVAPPTVEDLLQQAIEARTEGRLEDALSILQGAAEPGTMPAVLLLELASVQAQLGRTDDSIASYTRVLELDPGAVEARLQFARLLRGAGSRDEAERHCFVSLNASKTGDAEAAGKAVSLLLEIVREKAAEGDLPTAVESLLLLRSATACPQQPPLLSERAASASLELLGICGGEHLEELSVLPGEVLAGVVQQLKNAEDLALHGQLRSAADILYELIAENPDFLPAQSLLGRVVAAAGSRDAALNRSDRVAVLYDMRGSPHQGMELYRWRVVDGLADADARARLLSELKDQNRLDEAEVLQSGCLPGRWKVERATSAFELLPLPEPLEDLLRRAEAAFAGGDSTEAIQLLHSGLEDAPQVDTPTVAALLRMLQVSGESQVDGEQLRGALDEMGLPQGLADW